MSTSAGLLAVWMDIAPDLEGELNRWYEEEHLPERVAIPGFLSARRYESSRGDPKYVALYDLDSPSVLSSDAYMKVRNNATPWTSRILPRLASSIRNEYELVQTIGATPDEGGPFILLVRIETEPEYDHKLNEWDTTDHLPGLASVPGVLAAKRYRATAGSPRYLAMYELERAEVTESDAWRKAGDTEFSRKMRPLLRNVSLNAGRRLERPRTS